jgi:pyruvate/2-oxoglutarate dehydrogenase complex dihydrolipoamide dehydrogenase (E3) component
MAAREIPGWDSDQVVDAFDALRRRSEVGGRVVVVGGGLIGCQAALELATRGSEEISLVARGHTELFTDGEHEFAPDIVGTIVRPLSLERLRSR